MKHIFLWLRWCCLLGMWVQSLVLPSFAMRVRPPVPQSHQVTRPPAEGIPSKGASLPAAISSPVPVIPSPHAAHTSEEALAISSMSPSVPQALLSGLEASWVREASQGVKFPSSPVSLLQSSQVEGASLQPPYFVKVGLSDPKTQTQGFEMVTIKAQVPFKVLTLPDEASLATDETSQMPQVFPAHSTLQWEQTSIRGITRVLLTVSYPSLQPKQTWVFTFDPTFKQGQGMGVKLVAQTPVSSVLAPVAYWHILQKVSGQRSGLYTGVLSLFKPPGSPEAKTLLMNELPLDTYLLGVLPYEMSIGFALEALKAQAVVARNYALRSGRKRWQWFDHVDTTQSQVYGGLFMGDTSKLRQAIQSTRDLHLLTPSFQPALTYFYSTSGGVTGSLSQLQSLSAQTLIQKFCAFQPLLTPPPTTLSGANGASSSNAPAVRPMPITWIGCHCQAEDTLCQRPSRTTAPLQTMVQERDLSWVWDTPKLAFDTLYPASPQASLAPWLEAFKRFLYQPVTSPPFWDTQSSYMRWQWNLEGDMKTFQTRFYRGFQALKQQGYLAKKAVYSTSSQWIPSSPQALGDIYWAGPVLWQPNGRVLLFMVRTSQGAWWVAGDSAIRQLIRSDDTERGKPLQSNLFYCDAQQTLPKDLTDVRQEPLLTRLSCRGGGWGHGVGMSQYGAEGMARAGKTYQEILRHYYPTYRLGTLPISLSGSQTQQYRLHNPVSMTSALSKHRVYLKLHMPFSACRESGKSEALKTLTWSLQGLTMSTVPATQWRFVHCLSSQESLWQALSSHQADSEEMSITWEPPQELSPWQQQLLNTAQVYVTLEE